MQKYFDLPTDFSSYMVQLYDLVEGRRYTNHPADRGGPTKFGITLSTLRWFRKNKNLTAADVEKLTEAEATTIFRTKYYEDSRANEVPWWIGMVLVDSAINHGVANAVMFLQDVLNSFNISGAPRLKVDGAFGPNSEMALEMYLGLQIGPKEDFSGLNAATQKKVRIVANRMSLRRQEFYERLKQDSPEQTIFGMGWWVRNGSRFIMDR